MVVRGNLTKVFTGIVIAIALIVFFVRTKLAPSAQAVVILQVPFTPQAPTDNWSRNEDCEETSITMANAFLSGTTEDQVPAPEAQKAIDNLKIWEQGNLGYNANTGSDATTKMAEGAFALKVSPIKDFTEQDLKQALADKHPILLPVNAKVLNKQRYGDRGPLYHMIVIRGYKPEGFIVNDPGTNNGDGNMYSFNTLKSSASDWNQTTKSIDPNTKIALVLSK